MITMGATVLAVASRSDIVAYRISADEKSATPMAELQAPYEKAVFASLALTPSANALAVMLERAHGEYRVMTDEKKGILDSGQLPVVLVLNPATMQRFSRFEVPLPSPRAHSKTPLVFLDDGILILPLVAYKFSANMNHILHRVSLRALTQNCSASTVPADDINGSVDLTLSAKELAGVTDGHSLPLFDVVGNGVCPQRTRCPGVVFYSNRGPTIFMLSPSDDLYPVFRGTDHLGYFVHCVTGIVRCKSVGEMLRHRNQKALDSYLKVEGFVVDRLKAYDDSYGALALIQVPSCEADGANSMLVSEISAERDVNSNREQESETAGSRTLVARSVREGNFMEMRVCLSNKPALDARVEEVGAQGGQSDEMHCWESSHKPALLWALLTDSTCFPLHRLRSLEDRLKPTDFPLRCSVAAGDLVAVSTRCGDIHFVDFNSCASKVASVGRLIENVVCCGEGGNAGKTRVAASSVVIAGCAGLPQSSMVALIRTFNAHDGKHRNDSEPPPQSSSFIELIQLDGVSMGDI